MLAEFKRDAARKELGQLEEDIEERKQRLQQLTDGELQNEEQQKTTLQFKQKVRIYRFPKIEWRECRNKCTW